MAKQVVFQVEGLKEFTRDIRGLDPAIRRELVTIIAGASASVRDLAQADIPHHTPAAKYGHSRTPGSTAATISVTARGTSGKVTFAAGYARVIEFGTTVRRSTKGGGSTTYTLRALGPVPPAPYKGRVLLNAGITARNMYGEQLQRDIDALMDRAFPS